ncbi:lmo0937 family membrane protein [Hazenella sp. IB182353]|nr:lmo0937 family membrane protein [Polycladospora coralii]
MKTLLVIALILWLIGVLTKRSFGGFIHVLLVIAAILLILELL